MTTFFDSPKISRVLIKTKDSLIEEFLKKDIETHLGLGLGTAAMLGMLAVGMVLPPFALIGGSILAFNLVCILVSFLNTFVKEWNNDSPDAPSPVETDAIYPL